MEEWFRRNSGIASPRRNYFGYTYKLNPSVARG